MTATSRALVAVGLDAPEALVTHGAAGAVGSDVLKTSRAWPDDEWEAAKERLRSRGWLASDEALTAQGAEARERIEQQTDELAMRPWKAIGEEACTRLRELVRPWSRAISESDAEFPLR